MSKKGRTKRRKFHRTSACKKNGKVQVAQTSEKRKAEYKTTMVRGAGEGRDKRQWTENVAYGMCAVCQESHLFSSVSLVVLGASRGWGQWSNPEQGEGAQMG